MKTHRPRSAEGRESARAKSDQTTTGVADDLGEDGLRCRRQRSVPDVPVRALTKRPHRRAGLSGVNRRAQAIQLRTSRSLPWLQQSRQPLSAARRLLHERRPRAAPQARRARRRRQAGPATATDRPARADGESLVPSATHADDGRSRRWRAPCSRPACSRPTANFPTGGAATTSASE